MTVSAAVRTRLVLARHGQTDHNVAGRMQGRIDIALNDLGRAQARELARSIAGTGPVPDVIVASPLSRAAETARTVAEAVHADVVLDEGFVERGFGRWEGLTGPEIREQWPAEHDAWQHRHDVEGIGMETRAQAAERVGVACRRLLAEHEGRTVLVVAHGAAITLGICDLLGLDPYAFRGLAGLDNCHRSVLEPLAADPDGRLMRLVSHNVPPDFAA